MRKVIDRPTQIDEFQPEEGALGREEWSPSEPVEPIPENLRRALEAPGYSEP